MDRSQKSRAILTIVKSATEIVFELLNTSVSQYGITFREYATGLDAGSVEVASGGVGKFNPRGSIKPGDFIQLGLLDRG
ncbi:hypothetical protein N7522_009841 [Penicillium canescens]|uniref:Uncharacterized protein n=1 Tax=Penicillium canescens TaxID=5083 RepID=A0AAD6I0W3_PENCN|nr:uncharacterized protein N7446_004979 [Penicillium canescens]KAJ5998181.1 hypothetical protein N7522_009841 [Penicillium canescens]KAJ6026422.1 hypothetical protein N7460_011239 [Penicillium canescens]KAJ6039705.1 hypothetical protein N7444_008610 [Penicillium canescens]KAJ6067942.1 hypothetical protein N7446_004979 [Penicillium canescens]